METKMRFKKESWEIYIRWLYFPDKVGGGKPVAERDRELKRGDKSCDNQSANLK